MDRASHKKYIPMCPRNIGVVDQYMWQEKDTNKYHCHNGVSRPIYNINGEINRALPLEHWPKVDQVHPEIALTRRMHTNIREDPHSIERALKIKRIKEKISDRLSSREGYAYPRDDGSMCTGNCTTQKMNLPYGGQVEWVLNTCKNPAIYFNPASGCTRNY